MYYVENYYLCITKKPIKKYNIMTNIIILIILVPTALLLAIIFVGKQFRKMDVKDEQIHEAELKYLQDRAKELKELGLINSVYDFLTGANEQRNRQKEKGV